MDEDTLNDLKQFITATIRQETASLEERINAHTDSRVTELEHRTQASLSALEGHLNTRLDDLDNKVTTIADAHAEVLDDHERRVGRLEAGQA